MRGSERFDAVLNNLVARSGYTTGQLFRLSGVPKTTIASWMEGRVRRPREWRDLVRLARALHLSRREATTLLRAAGHPTLEALEELAAEPLTEALFDLWRDEAVLTIAQSPFQAIPRPVPFVPRKEVIALEGALRARTHATPYCLVGIAGGGKTTLAAQLAYQLRAHFPDGVLWARLDQSDTMSILRTFAAAYGRDVGGYTDLDSRSRVVRELLADKRALLVLDNAQQSQAVQPLLPPTGPCATLITTRRHDLAIVRGAEPFRVGPFSAEGALHLLRQILTDPRIPDECLHELAALLGYLPLALSIAATRIVYEPGWTVNSYLVRVRQAERRLQELSLEGQSVRRVFAESVAALSPAHIGGLAALSHLDRTHFDAAEVAAQCALPPDVVADDLRVLYNHSLLEQHAGGRYSIHPLLRDYAYALRREVVERPGEAVSPPDPLPALSLPPITGWQGMRIGMIG